jgi:uncharacterized protein involved in exopolysaccharide biosynthesis
MQFPIRKHDSHGAVQSAASRALAAAPVGPLAEPRLPSDADGAVFVMADLRDLRDLLGLPRRSVMRHKRVFAAVAGAMILLGMTAAAVLPRHYLIETKLLAERNVTMPLLGNPRRAVPTESDTPSRLAAEAVMKRENLISIVREAKLMEEWQRLRSPLGRVRDYVGEQLDGPQTEEERLNAMVGLLEQRMWVIPSEGTVTIGLDWMDPQTGLRIVQSAQRNFFEQRHASEIGMIGESIEILNGYVANAERSIQAAIEQINAAERRKPAPATPVRVRTGPVPPSPAARARAEQVATLQAALATKRQTIGGLESGRATQLAAAQDRLARLRESYGTAHPEVGKAMEDVRALSAPPPQLAALRSEEAVLAAQLRELGGSAAPSTMSEPSFAREVISELARPRAADTTEAPQVTNARARLKIATSNYEDMLTRTEAARIELETARAAFKYRYNVIKPAQLPKRPYKPKIPLIVVGGVIMGIGLGVFAALALDLASGRVLERWQVTRQLGLPVLAQVRNP